MSIVIVVAAARNGVIGNAGAIPWHLPEDLKRFKALTLGHPIVMGRKTWDSLPRKPLPGRTNIVITRDPNWSAPGAVRSGLDEAETHAGHGDLMVIGGAEIYRHFLPRAQRIELTEVQGDFAGDAVFMFDRGLWRETARKDHESASGLRYSFVTLVR